MKAWNRKEHQIIDGIEMKHCGHCHEWKPFSHYGKCNRQWDGLREVCKLCRKEETVRFSEERKAYFKIYHEEHKEERNKFMREYFVRTKYNQKKRAESVTLRLHVNFGNLVRHSLKYGKRRSSWESILGYNRNELKSHLESGFTDGMTWDNYGKWHVDHIIPVSAYDFETYTDDSFIKCWSLNNLQPLWAHDNIVKGGKY